MSERLTVGTKDCIAKDILEHRFGDLRKTLDQEQLAIGAEALKLLFTDKERKVMESLPDGWLPIRYKISVRFGMANSRYYDELPVEPGVRVRYDQQYGCLLALENDHPLVARYALYHQAREDWKTHHAAAVREIRAVLNQAYSIKSLRKLWPEIGSFLDKYEVASTAGKVQLPAIQMQTLNSLLNLPPEKIEVAA